MNRLRLATAVLFVVLGVLSGCGGADDETSARDAPASTATTTAAPLTKQEFLEQGNKLCKIGNTAINAGVGQVDTSDKQALADAVTQTLVPGVRQQVQALRDLGFPAGDEQRLDAVLDQADAALDALEADPGLLVTGKPFAEVNKALDAYGLTGCGSGG